MRSIRQVAAAIGVASLCSGSSAVAQHRDDGVPRLRKQGTAMQLVVDGAPFLIRGGELGNSTASSLAEMRPIWPKLRAMHLNTVVAPVYWELIEPEESRYNDARIRPPAARRRARRDDAVSRPKPPRAPDIASAFPV